MRVNDAVFVQVCDPVTGEAIAEGEGEVVITRLRGEYPLVRFGTGDLSAWQLDSDGGLRLAGVLGRVGEAVKVRGMFLHPRQAAAALGDVPGVSGFRFVVRRQDHVDAIRCEVVGADGGGGDAGAAELVGRVTAAIRERLRFRAEVVVVERLPEDSPVLVDERDWS
jgi:phenylacetate-CoA ligase